MLFGYTSLGLMPTHLQLHVHLQVVSCVQDRLHVVLATGRSPSGVYCVCSMISFVSEDMLRPLSRGTCYVPPCSSRSAGRLTLFLLHLLCMSEVAVSVDAAATAPHTRMKRALLLLDCCGAFP